MIQFIEYNDTPYAQISIAFFVGFGFNRFLNKLNVVSKKFFQPEQETNNTSN
jgi:hypothetical protein